MILKQEVLNKLVAVWPTWKKVALPTEDRACVTDSHFSIQGGQ